MSKENENGNFAKPMLCDGLNEKTTTEIERLIFNILDKYQINPSIQPNLAIDVLKTCDAYLERK